MKLLRWFLVLAIIPIVGCHSQLAPHASTPEKPLFKVSVCYPGGEGKTFDMSYYESKHMPMVAAMIGKNLKFYEIEKGVGGRTPTDPAPYMAIGSFYVKDTAAYHQAIGNNIETIRNDFKNYTNVLPVVQISEVRYAGR